MSDNLMTIQDAAAYLSVAPITIRRLISRGELKARKVGRVIRLDPRDVAKVGKPIRTYTPAAREAVSADA